MKKWPTNLRVIEEQQRGEREKSINLAIVSANNHYAGFGPETANIFRKMVGLPSINWQDAKDKSGKLIQTYNNPAIPAEQKSLSDYL